MANTNAPHGLQPIGTLTGASWDGKANLYHIPSADTNAYYIGDVVVLASTGSDTNGVPDVALMLTTNSRANNVVAGNPVGVVVGFQVSPVGVNQGGMVPGNNVNLNIDYIPATKAADMYVYIADDPNLLFEIMGNNTATLTAATTVGYNAAFLPSAPANSITPVSGGVLVTSTLATTATLPLHVVALPFRPNVDFTANTPLVVKFNNHQYAMGTAGV